MADLASAPPQVATARVAPTRRNIRLKSWTHPCDKWWLIQLSHTLHVFNLPNLHQDPFDRLLIAQSQLEDLPLLTADAEITRYDVKVIW